MKNVFLLCFLSSFALLFSRSSCFFRFPIFLFFTWQNVCQSFNKFDKFGQVDCQICRNSATFRRSFAKLTAEVSPKATTRIAGTSTRYLQPSGWQESVPGGVGERRKPRAAQRAEQQKYFRLACKNKSEMKMSKGIKTLACVIFRPNIYLLGK